ncbi:hypothetical protein TRAPUB_8778 [Trametes pubescens]|uniref:Uncharacterized protein n=1 Tax=Trametes pubescens TaxID=154538 RepID=A0A1M2W4G8_TRAPU|nr:hypothetical protein TRAPUB_8778 [Trametes pubescens]
MRLANKLTGALEAVAYLAAAAVPGSITEQNTPARRDVYVNRRYVTRHFPFEAPVPTGMSCN